MLSHFINLYNFQPGRVSQLWIVAFSMQPQSILILPACVYFTIFVTVINLCKVWCYRGSSNITMLKKNFRVFILCKRKKF